MYLVVGLGNPGEEYSHSRHNLGFMVLEEVARQLGIENLKNNRKCNALVAEADYEGRRLILAEPQTFMNHSGQVVRELLLWHKINPANLILIYDDLDLEPGSIRVRSHGSAGGHHGVESVIQHLKTNDFVRVRAGIGKPPLAEEGVNYVLSKIPLSQREKIAEGIGRAAEAVLTIVLRGVDQAMNTFNA